ASHIICISNQTKKDLTKYYKVKKSKISVIYLGTENKSKKINFKKKKIILFVGSRVGYKNFINLLKAFGKSRFLKNNFKILCFGGETLTIEEKKIINRLNLRKNIFFDNGDEKKLNTYYKKASLYVSVSLFEGFGLTLLEAMRMGCPVLCSNIPTFREIFNNSCIFVNPKNTENIRKKLERVLKSKKEQKKLIQKGFITVSKYNWDRCILETAKIYEKILNGEKKFDFSSDNKL
ncbi:glycosyltransferase family 4 protein, partial [Candidatus Pelagibacter sp.]|nr:glycosyltransferase family 4 protein [Candidatus Pelagibacter sp.]